MPKANANDETEDHGEDRKFNGHGECRANHRADGLSGRERDTEVSGQRGVEPREVLLNGRLAHPVVVIQSRELGVREESYTHAHRSGYSIARKQT